MRAHTWTYVTDFAARVDEVSRNFNFVRSCSRNSCVCGVCQWSEAARRDASGSLLLSPIYLQDFLELISSCSLAISSSIVIVVVSPLSRSRTATVPSSASFAPITSM